MWTSNKKTMLSLKDKSKQFNCNIHCKIISLLLALHIIIALTVITYKIIDRSNQQNNGNQKTQTIKEQRHLQ